MTTEPNRVQKRTNSKKGLFLALLLASAAAAAWQALGPSSAPSRPDPGPRTAGAVPVTVAPVVQGPIVQKQTFNGELEARSEFVVAPKIGGRVKHIKVHIADAVQQGQVVAELDNDEYIQTVAQAEADLAVAQANHHLAQRAVEIARREFNRTRSLSERGISSDADLDSASRDLLVKEAQLKVTTAQITKATASLKSARIRLGYTDVTADWKDGGIRRVVAERYVDEGQTVAANTPLLRIVEMNPIAAIVFVTEKDYPRLKPGQTVTLMTETYPSERFSGHIDRIAPVFRKSSRQARVEMTIANPDHRLKPGMFIKAAVDLARVPSAVIVPREALTIRDGQSGVFIVHRDKQTAAWHPVEVGIRENGRVQVIGEKISGEVITLGQHLLSEGAPVLISSGPKPSGPANP